MSLRAAIYARVSSDAQRKERTIESQLRDLPAFCRARGWTIVDTYVDDGKSAATGKLDKRTGFARLLADAAAGCFDVVVVVDQDRLTRTSSLAERGAIMGAFQAAGVKLAIASTGQVLDLDTDEGDLMGSFGAYVAAAENRKRLKRTLAGKETTILRGGKPRGSTPVGLLYVRGSNDRGIPPTWAIDPTWAPIIREAFERTARGERIASIAADFTRRGLKRPRGGEWHPSRLRSTIASETYTGRYVVDRATGRAVAVPPIVDADLAAEARAVLHGRYRTPPPPTRHPHYLVGRLWCGVCHEPMGLHGYTVRGGPVHAYVCRARKWRSIRGRSCAMPRVRVDEIDALAWREVSALLATDAIVDRAFGGGSARLTSVDDAALEAARAELTRIDGLIADVLAHAADGLVSREVADAHVRRLGADRKAAHAAVRAAQTARAGIRPAMDRAALAERVGLLARWCADPRTTAAQRAEMMRALVEAATLRPGALTLDLRIPVDTVQVAAVSRSSGALSAGRLTIYAPLRAA